MSSNRFFTLETESRNQFYQVPKQFMMKESKYYVMNSDSKLLYGLLADRNSLSISNGWLDIENKIYFVATVESLMELTGWGKGKVIKHLKELRTFELLLSEQKGQGNPSWHYLLQIEVENGLEIKSYQQKSENQTSRSSEIKLQEVLKSDSNNTNTNNTNINKEIREGKPSSTGLSNVVSAILPIECINDLDKYSIGRLKKERDFYNIDFNSGLYYNAFADALVKTQLQDSVEILTKNQYAYFISTLKKMIEPLELEKKLLG